ncbi:MAG TPA: PfkB family carbohydrate kinase [Holophaga sp.]|nr:PfkB family carbohydrate kinase [Holophaga sp.]
MSLLAVGSLAFDDLETPSGRQSDVLGGSVSYFSLAASHFHPVQVVAVAGEDFGPGERAIFEGRPIDLAGLETKAGKCFRWKGVYGENLNEAITLETHLNVFETFNPRLPEAFRSSEFLFLGNIAPSLQMHVLEQMAARPRWVALDTMNFWIQGSTEDLRRVLAKVDILLVNETEARLLSGKRLLQHAYQRIREMGPRVLVVKRGENGVMLFSDEGLKLLPAFPVESVVDPTGAGDTFAGGFLGHLASVGKLDLETCHAAAAMGTVMASFTVEDFGLRRLSKASRSEIDSRLRAFSGMIRVDRL